MKTKVVPLPSPITKNITDLNEDHKALPISTPFNPELNDFIEKEFKKCEKYRKDLILPLLSLLFPVVMDLYGFFSRTYIITGCYTLVGNGKKGEKLDYGYCLSHNQGSSEYSIKWLDFEDTYHSTYIWLFVITSISTLVILILFSCHLIINKRNKFITRLLPYQIIIIKGIPKCPIILLVFGVFVVAVLSIEIPIIFFQVIASQMRFSLPNGQLAIEFSDSYIDLVVFRGINSFLLYIPYFYNFYMMMRSPYNGFFNLEEILKDPAVSLDSFNDGKNLEITQAQINIVTSKIKRGSKEKDEYLKEIAKSCYENFKSAGTVWD